MAASGHKGISRIDQPSRRTHGWYVRVSFRGEQRARFVSDQMYGGKRKALREAVRVRDGLEDELGRPHTDRQVVGRAARTNTGIVGVQRTRRRERRRDGTVALRDVFMITWMPEPGVTSRTTVSVAKWGEGEAFRIACQVRAEKESEMYGQIVQEKLYDFLDDEA